MAQRVIKNNIEIAKQIKQRRMELHMTIENAATKAGVGTKTWSRYEAGESIRLDKCKGICRALNWPSFPIGNDGENSKEEIDYEQHEVWSVFLVESFGYMAALSFAVGSDLLLDKINQDLDELSALPRHTHLGQLSFSHIVDSLPPQFLMEYDYNFVYLLRSALIELQNRARLGNTMYAHTVLEEVLFYICVEEAKAYIELVNEKIDNEDEDWEDWIYDLFDDTDILYSLYSNKFIDVDNRYHFIHWNEHQFCLDW